jgi:hypothetical protein
MIGKSNWFPEKDYLFTGFVWLFVLLLFVPVSLSLGYGIS